MLKFRFQTRFRGQSAVEFALVGPLFFVMLFGVIELAHGAFVIHQVTNTAREGARWAMVRGENTTPAITNADVTDYVLDVAYGLDANALSVDPAWPSGNAVGSPVRVTITYDYTPLIGRILGTGSITITRSSQMTIQY